MAMRKKLPIGIESFEEAVYQGFYFVDKTEFISTLLNNWGKVNLFTRPRRFGKSLNMSMLKAFFEIGCDKALFDGLKISSEKGLCEEYMGKFPVIFISLKGVDGLDYESAYSAIRNIIGNEALRFDFLADSALLSPEEKVLYAQLVRMDKGKTPEDNMFTMSKDILELSLRTLSMLLKKHYGRETIILIDEYDVPLDKAFQGGYYDRMVSLIRSIFGNALKTNPNLYFAVLTGCMRISKESIFTGLNNLNVLSITNARFDEYFGFTDEEVMELLEYYGLTEHYGTIKEWYDGYRFGNVSVYSPWDVIRYCDALLEDPQAPPEDYWSNTSSNSIVRRFIDKAGARTREEIESLIAGETIVKEIRQDLTYNEVDSSIENLWSVLFTTGYLTQRSRIDGKTFELAIPNREVKELFVSQIKEWFKESSTKDAPKLDRFCEAFPAGDAETIEELFDDYLWNSISVRDSAARKGKKENFYHGMLLGLLHHKENWLVKSNVESGEGYSDIIIEVPESRTGVVVELKYAESGGGMEVACVKALGQIDTKDYTAYLEADGMKNIVKIGIACFRKHCRVQLGE